MTNTTQNQSPLSPEEQQKLNTPLAEQGVVSDRNRDFLKVLLDLVESKKIDLYQPSTLLNYSVYERLSGEEKGKVDLEAVNLLAAIREIKGLADAGFSETYQMANLLERLFNTKSRLEEAGGDLFVI